MEHISGMMFSGETIDENTNMTDPITWPTPPTDKGAFREDLPSRSKPRSRGEKSVYDSEGGEWRPHKPDKYHPDGHWDYKPPGKAQKWQDISVSGELIP